MAGAAVFRATRTEAMNTNTKLATGLLVAALGAGTGYVLVTPKATSDLPPLPTGMKAEAVTIPSVPQPEIVVTSSVTLAWNIENNYAKHAHERWPLHTGIVGMWEINGSREQLYECSTFDANGDHITEFTTTVVTTNRFFNAYTR